MAEPAISDLPASVGSASGVPPEAAALPDPPAETRPLAAETLRRYHADWEWFATWCAAHGHSALPAKPYTVAAFLAAQPSRRGTLGRHAAAIAYWHRLHGLPAPNANRQVTAILQTVRRASPSRRPPAQLRKLAATCPGDTAGLRDRALLLLAATLSRTGVTQAALLGLTVEQLRFTPEGMTLRLPYAPADETADWETAPTRRLAIPADGGRRPGLCPVQALRDWLSASDTLSGPVFRKVDRWGHVEHQPVGPDGLRRVIARRSQRRARRSVPSLNSSSVPTLTLVARGPPFPGWWWRKRSRRRALGRHCGAPGIAGWQRPTRPRF